MGRLADGPKKRRVIVFPLAVVFAGCVLSAVSTGFALLVIGRGLQGVGLGLMPVTMAIARSQFSPQKTARAVATLSVSVAVRAGLGYPITSLIAEFYDYRAAFWFGAITVASALVLVVLVLPSQSDGRSRRFDYLGMATPGTAVVGVWNARPTVLTRRKQEVSPSRGRSKWGRFWRDPSQPPKSETVSAPHRGRAVLPGARAPLRDRSGCQSRT